MHRNFLTDYLNKNHISKHVKTELSNYEKPDLCILTVPDAHC